MQRPDWYYDDLKQIGTDFADAGDAVTYDKTRRRTVRMEGLIKQAGFYLTSAEYSNGVYADYLAVRPA